MSLLFNIVISVVLYVCFTSLNMDDVARTLLQRTLRKIPTRKLEETIKKWSHLSRRQQQSLNYTQSKWILLQKLVSFCEDNELTVRHVSELEMIYCMENPNLGTWKACHLTDAEDDATSLDLMCFKEQFKSHLAELTRNVSIKIKKHENETIWIRIAWGENFIKPNHLKPTYVVHDLQTPYVFICNLSSKNKPLLYQTLVLATKHGSIKDAHLSGRNLHAVRDLLMGNYHQTFPTNHQRPLEEMSPPPTHPNIENEHKEHAEKRQQVACEAFGEGKVPKLETATYTLETRFRGGGSIDTLVDGEKPFRTVVQFASTSLLESLHHCVSSGIADAPVSPLLSSITQKGRNYFVITDKADR
ncbi:centromere protein N [Clupea harengus]|uniref:Centromere protein N n=1 Tax=Clupea harengus TaxID=7950 RepID=A0A6P3VLZ1_CLUHA|nr:centromere protein N [Clupea harengus]